MQTILFWATIVENWKACFVLVSHYHKLKAGVPTLRDSSAIAFQHNPLNIPAIAHACI
jgi:hypothetical protein